MAERKKTNNGIGMAPTRAVEETDEQYEKRVRKHER
jgi:hypothetical protein